MIRLLERLPGRRFILPGWKAQEGAGTAEILECFRQVTDAPCEVFDRTEQAFDAALHDEDKEGRLLCLGSLYLVGEIKRRKTYILESEDSHD